MSERCTCGAYLPQDARFCHRCGKPQFEEPVAESAPADATPELTAVPLRAAQSAEPEINFRNLAAVRIGLMMAALTTLATLFMSPAGSAGALFILLPVLALLSGFCAVAVYRRRTGKLPSISGGAKLGWITGVFNFVISTVLFTAGVVLTADQGGLQEMYRRQANAMGVPQQNMQRAIEVLENPTALSIGFLFALMFYFLLYTSVTSVGGALGAKMLARD